MTGLDDFGQDSTNVGGGNATIDEPTFKLWCPECDHEIGETIPDECPDCSYHGWPFGRDRHEDFEPEGYEH